MVWRVTRTSPSVPSSTVCWVFVCGYYSEFSTVGLSVFFNLPLNVTTVCEYYGMAFRSTKIMLHMKRYMNDLSRNMSTTIFGTVSDQM